MKGIDRNFISRTRKDFREIFHYSFESDETRKCILTKYLKKHDITAEGTQCNSHTFCYRLELVTRAPPDGGKGIVC